MVIPTIVKNESKNQAMQILSVMKQHIPHPIHALDLKCMTPKQAETAGDTAFDPHGGGQGVHIKRIMKNKEK